MLWNSADVGGWRYEPQSFSRNIINSLSRDVENFVATGVLLDHIKAGSCANLRTLKNLILDEADRMP